MHRRKRPGLEPGEGEHGEERGVQVARVLVALDAFVAAAEVDQGVRGDGREVARNDGAILKGVLT
jgi:hypothetical protein